MRSLLKPLILCVSLFLVLGSVGLGVCQENSLPSVFQMSIEDLCNLEVVSTSKRAESQLESPAVIQILTSEDIAMLGFNSLEECLEYVVGISSVNGEGNIFTTTTIRGNTLVNYNTNTLLLFDYIPIYSPYHGSFDFSFIPLAAIDRVEIVKGANSVLYGSNAINAVINVISKRAATDKTYQFQAKTSYGSYETGHVRGALLARQNDWEIDLFGDFTHVRGEKFTIHDEARQQLSYRKELDTHSAVVKISFKGLTLHLQDYRRRLTNYRTRGFSRGQDNDEEAQLVNLDWHYNFSEKYGVHLRTSYYDWQLEKSFEPEFDPALSEYDWDYEGSLWSSELELSFNPIAGWKNIVGLGYSRAEARRYKGNTGDYDIGKYDEPVHDWSLYLNGSYQISDKLNFIYGGRYYYSETLCELTGKDISDDDLSLRFGLVYRLKETFYLKLLYGEAFRIPTFFEKQVASCTMIGNPDLSPEQSVSYDLVLTSLFGWGRVDLDFYYMKIEDKITRVAVAGGMMQNRNIGVYTFKGVELNSRFHFGNVQGFAGYAFCYGEDDESSEKLDLTYSHMVTLAGSYKVSENLKLQLSTKYLSSWGEADAYFIANGGFSYRPWPKQGWVIQGKIDNLFGSTIELPEIARQKEEVETIPRSSGRYFYIGLSCSF